MTNDEIKEERLKALKKYIQEPQYLGDGLYVDYDGYRVQIRVNDHKGTPVAYLDSQVINRMAAYLAVIKEAEKI